MRKLIIILIILGLFVCLGAQQSQQVTKGKKVQVKKKIDYEIEYYKLEEERAKLEKVYMVLKAEHEELRRAKKELKIKHDEMIEKRKLRVKNVRKLQNKIIVLREENEQLKKENAKLKAELEEYRPKKKKVKTLKKVEQK